MQKFTLMPYETKLNALLEAHKQETTQFDKTKQLFEENKEFFFALMRTWAGKQMVRSPWRRRAHFSKYDNSIELLVALSKQDQIRDTMPILEILENKGFVITKTADYAETRAYYFKHNSTGVTGTFYVNYTNSSKCFLEEYQETIIKHRTVCL